MRGVRGQGVKAAAQGIEPMHGDGNGSTLHPDRRVVTGNDQREMSLSP